MAADRLSAWVRNNLHGWQKVCKKSHAKASLILRLLVPQDEYPQSGFSPQPAASASPAAFGTGDIYTGQSGAGVCPSDNAR